jgi:dTDP-4-amino-4,6-dideoxygalactose transaminase
MKKIIPYGRQYIDKSDIQQVASALSKDKLTTGELTLKFENVNILSRVIAEHRLYLLH